MISLPAAALFIIAVSGSILCANKTEKKIPERDPITIVNVNNSFNETARFIAGLEISESSPLYKYTLQKDYIRYRKMVNKSWEGFFVENMEKCRKWRNRFLPKDYDKKIFYPFSGPDILHPLVFFPKSKDIVMFGLEPVGEIPDPRNTKKGQVVRALWGLSGALNFMLRHAFFVTADMGKRMRRGPYAGITGVMMFFLARGGFEVMDIKKIWLTGRGVLSAKKPAGRKRKVAGVEIVFRKTGDSEKRRARFFRLDISDRSKSFPIFSEFIKKYPMFTSIIKSASYLMHNPKKFSKIRNLILNRSSSILQDDSGIPIKVFSEKLWDLSYHGEYHKPLKVFKMYYQKSLKEKLKKYSTGPLPFSYGYGYGFEDMTYHLVFAKRKESAGE